MKRTAQINLERPTLSAVRRNLPAERKHLFLRLMPYSYGAPHDYGELQTVVYHAPVPDDRAQCVEALEQLAALYDHGLRDLPARGELLAEVAFRIRQRHFSCLAAELEFVTRLGMDDITLDEFKIRGEIAGVPMLVGKVRWFKGKPESLSGALRSVEEAIAALTAMPAHELATMPVRERMAGIRLIRLFSLFGTAGDQGPVGESRWQRHGDDCSADAKRATWEKRV
jgi:hypothetical protein